MEERNKEDELKKEFIKMFLSDDYILWLKAFMDKYNDIDNVYFVHNNCLNKEDELRINYLEYLFIELNKYTVKNNINHQNVFCYLLKYDDSIYEIRYNGEGYSCTKHDYKIYQKRQKFSYCIDYKDLKKQYGKQMQINFDFLDARVLDALKNTDLDQIRFELRRINSPTLVSGVGGSNVVSEFASKVLREKNGIISLNVEPRDFVYERFPCFKNVLACSYSGNNYGVDLAFKNNLKKYLLSNNSFNDEDVTYLRYHTTIPEENSFISLGATLIPISIMMGYYQEGKDNFGIIERTFDFDTTCDAFEIFSGNDTSTTSKYLESTLSESGIGLPIVHDKYSYCHGRSTLSINYNNIAIYLNRNTELDKLLLRELPKYYKDIIVIDSKEKDPILDDYQMLIQAMFLTKYLAEKKQKDLSKVEYSPICKKLYKYKGEV